MNKKSKLLLALLSIGLVGGSSLLSSCGERQQQEIKNADCLVRLSVSKIDLTVGDSYLLKASVSGGSKDSTLAFTSLNSDIVSVTESGLLKALKPGKAEIRAIYGDALAKCEVDVSLSDNVPSIVVQSVNSNSIKIDTITKVDLNPMVNFNNSLYAFEPSYALSDESVGKIENGAFVPLKNGKTFVTIFGSFFGKNVVPYTLEIEVQDNIVIFMKEVNGIETSNIHLFSHKGTGDVPLRTSFAPEFGVYLNNTLVDSPTLTIDFDNDDGALDYNPVTHEVKSTFKAGEGQYNVTYTDSSLNTFYKSFKVFNDKTILRYEGEVIETDSFGTELPLNDIFKDFPSKELTSATTVDQQTEFDIVDNKIVGLPTSIEDGVVNDQEFIVFNNSVGYIVNFKVYTKIIKTAQDLEVLNMKNTTDIINGYYYLANDIDGGGYVLKPHVRTAGAAYSFYPDNGFIGIFEGNGHVIKNIEVGEGGIFGLLSMHSIIRNFAVTNIKFSTNTGDDTPILATYLNGCSMSNVYINNDYMQGSNNASLIAVNVMNNCSISNCMFVLGDSFNPDSHAVNGNYGVIGSMYGERNSLPNGSQFLFTDTFVVSKTALVHHKASNQYVVDTDEKFCETNYEFFRILNIVHYADFEEMKSSGETFDSFSKQYWSVSLDGVLTWKNL